VYTIYFILIRCFLCSSLPPFPFFLFFLPLLPFFRATGAGVCEAKERNRASLFFYFLFLLSFFLLLLAFSLCIPIPEKPNISVPARKFLSLPPPFFFFFFLFFFFSFPPLSPSFPAAPGYWNGLITKVSAGETLFSFLPLFFFPPPPFFHAFHGSVIIGEDNVGVADLFFPFSFFSFFFSREERGRAARPDGFPLFFFFFSFPPPPFSFPLTSWTRSDSR